MKTTQYLLLHRNTPTTFKYEAPVTNLKNLLLYRSEYGMRELDYSKYNTIYATLDKTNVIGNEFIIAYIPNKEFAVVLTDATPEQILENDGWCLIQDLCGYDLVPPRKTTTRRTINRPVKMQPIDYARADIEKLYSAGVSITDICARLEFSESTLRNRMKKWGLRAPLHVRWGAIQVKESA
jgi:hypothetical protein